MNAIPSAIRSGGGRLTFPLHIDINQKLIIPDHGFSELKSFSEDTLQLHLQTLPGQLDEYFKHVGDEIKKNMDYIISRVKEIDWTDKQSIMDGLQPILDYLKPVFDFVKEHPWILIPLIIPVLELFIGLLGFGVEGVIANSLAAVLQSRIRNVEKGSIFAFLQSVGAGGWGQAALRRTNMFVTIAVLIAAVGAFLIEQGIIDPDAIRRAMEGAWNREVEKFDPPPISSVGSQVTVLNLDGGFIRYGLLAWVLMYGAVCAGEGGVF
ncbi:hypothetical protein EV426DRAFT_720141 [Tirmania nivea]|nr:hypothetical protein EV426DRAFT_720141 [Tirmania nivea]